MSRSKRQDLRSRRRDPEGDARFAGIDSAARFLNRRILKRLGRILDSDEPVRHAVQGTRDGRSGLLVATDRRVVWVRERGLLPPSTEAVAVRGLRAVEMHAVGHRARILLHLPDGLWRIESVRARSGAVLQEHVDAAMRGEAPTKSFEAEAPDEEGERARRVERLQRRGSMTRGEAEWVRRKRKK